MDVMCPSQSDIDINDIAHALSMICRFGGHTKYHYSVAQHSVYVSRLVPKPLRMAALLHDAAEAYIGDMVRPVKTMMHGFQKIEAIIATSVRLKYGLTLDEVNHDDIHQADLAMLATERQQLMRELDLPWPILNNIEPAEIHIKPMMPNEARDLFLLTFHTYQNHRTKPSSGLIVGGAE